MVLADAGITLIWVGGVLLVGFVGFFVVLLSMLARALGFVWRALIPRRHNRSGTILESRCVGQVCPHPRCGHINRAEARYCARCGNPLGDPEDVDSYG